MYNVIIDILEEYAENKNLVSALAGYEKIIFVNSHTGEGVWQILDYLKDEGEKMP